MGNEKKRSENIFVNILENFIILMILLVLIQTFLEDFSVWAGFNIEVIRITKIKCNIF
jgi:hypothetical protein